MADSLPASVAPPVAPGAPDAWYAPTVRAQYRIAPDVVATVRDGADGFTYETRAPPQSVATRRAVERVRTHLEDVDVDRPRTREGTVERVAAGLSRPYRQVVERLLDPTPAQRRRLDYHLVASLEGLGPLTPLALDDRIRIADTGEEGQLAVHTADFAPARTTLPADVPYLDRFLSERLAHYTVDVLGHPVPVTISRERVLGSDVFETKYHVHEPARLPGDDALVEAVRDRIVDESLAGPVEDRIAYVRQRARRLLRRGRITKSPRSAMAQAGRQLRRGLASLGLVRPPLVGRDADEYVDDLVYGVLRDLVGEDRLSVPIRDPHLERVEANRVGERVKVVPKPGAVPADGRMPTTRAIESERRFVTLATRLAAAGGVELGPRTPHATVHIEPTAAGPISCAVALPSASTDGPFVSIDKRGLHPVTPVELLDADVLAPETVAMLWLAIERHQAIAFVGPERARPAALLEAHAPFVPFGDRPVVVAEGTRSITLPHETGVELTSDALARTSDGTTPLDRASDLGPDVTVMTDLRDDPAYRHLSDALAAGRGVLVSGVASGVAGFARRAVERGLSLETLGALDLVVVVETVEGEPRVTAVEMPVERADRGRAVVNGPRGSIRSIDLLADATADGDADADVDANDDRFAHLFASLASASATTTVDDLIAEHRRLTRYVQYLQTADVRETDRLFTFLADLRTDEAATVERIHRVLSE